VPESCGGGDGGGGDAADVARRAAATQLIRRRRDRPAPPPRPTRQISRRQRLTDRLATGGQPTWSRPDYATETIECADVGNVFRLGVILFVRTRAQTIITFRIHTVLFLLNVFKYIIERIINQHIQIIIILFYFIRINREVL